MESETFKLLMEKNKAKEEKEEEVEVEKKEIVIKVE